MSETLHWIILVASWVFFVVVMYIQNRNYEICIKLLSINYNATIYQLEMVLKCIEIDRNNRTLSLVK